MSMFDGFLGGPKVGPKSINSGILGGLGGTAWFPGGCAGPTGEERRGF